MSRVGKNPVPIPSGVTVTINGTEVTVKGPKGSLTRSFDGNITIKQEENNLIFERANDLPKARALHGTSRALVNNMVLGVSIGFTKSLDLVGVGYRVAQKGKGLTLSLGYSHPVEIDAIEGITLKAEGNTKIVVEGIEKDKVGQIAANIRAKRPPEPYKGKGVKYSDEVVRRKEGKKS